MLPAEPFTPIISGVTPELTKSIQGVANLYPVMLCKADFSVLSSLQVRLT